MDVQTFRQSLEAEAPPKEVGPALGALWWDAKGDWAKAHECAQQDEGADGSWVHAYLHRKEGDLSNAGYWYRRCGKSAAASSLEAEWTAIARELLAAQ